MNETQPKPPAHWKDRTWEYHRAESHVSAHDFRERQIARGLKPRETDAPRRIIGQRGKV